MRNTRSRIALFTILFSLLLTGCRTKERVVETPVYDMASMAVVSASPAVSAPVSCLSGNMKFAVNVDGKPISAKGTLRIKENCGVQMGVTALGLVEIACVEFFPTNARLIYKLGKEYTDVAYSDVSFLKKSGIDYRMLESVLMNRVFSPDGRPAVQSLKEMTFANEGDCVTATTKEFNGITYKFHIDKESGNLVRSEGLHAGGGKVVCDYSDFNNVDGAPFPHTLSLSLHGVGKSVALQIFLSRVDTDEFTFTPRSLSSSYDRMQPEQMLKVLDKLK